jgi:hypothetical protein
VVAAGVAGAAALLSCRTQERNDRRFFFLVDPYRQAVRGLQYRSYIDTTALGLRRIETLALYNSYRGTRIDRQREDSGILRHSGTRAAVYSQTGTCECVASLAHSVTRSTHTFYSCFDRMPS